MALLQKGCQPQDRIPVLDISAAIRRGLNLPVTSISQEHFGFFGFFAGRDSLISSAQTREQLGWNPERPLSSHGPRKMHYFQNEMTSPRTTEGWKDVWKAASPLHLASYTNKSIASFRQILKFRE